MVGREEAMRAVRRSRSRHLVLVLALVIGLAALFADSADAHRRNGRSHRHAHARRVLVVPRPVPRHVVPRYVVEPRCVIFPGYVGSPVITVGRDRMHWSASLGLYIPNLRLEASFGEWAPRGSVYYDPYCACAYPSLSAYRVHMHDCGHPAALMLTAAMPVTPGAMLGRRPSCGPQGH
jgi:hypothetical protein